MNTEPPRQMNPDFLTREEQRKLEQFDRVILEKINKRIIYLQDLCDKTQRECEIKLNLKYIDDYNGGL